MEEPSGSVAGSGPLQRGFLEPYFAGVVFYRRTAVLPAFSLAGCEYKVDVRDNQLNQTSNRLGVDFFFQHRERIMNPLENNVYIGLTRVPESFEGYTYYMPSLPVGPASILPEDMTLRQIKAHRYGVFTYMGQHRPEEISSITLKDIWYQVFEVWMPTVKISLPETFSFERIDYARCTKQYCECDLYYPIEPVQDSGRHVRQADET
ncbi:Bacterial transcription activator, effector binding domain [compost metagenome]